MFVVRNVSSTVSIKRFMKKIICFRKKKEFVVQRYEPMTNPFKLEEEKNWKCSTKVGV